MFRTIFIALVGLWSLCLVEGIGGRLIHVLPLMAAIALLYQLLGGRRATG